MRYLPETDADRAAMLRELGLATVDPLFQDIPETARLSRPLDIPGPLSELDLQQKMTRTAARNRAADTLSCFLGGQFYDRFVPAAVGALAFRGEFATSYTPYQPELSQGTLAAIFEFQTMIASLTGMAAAQASMYDGSSALAEAALLAVGVTGRSRLVLDEALFPDAATVVGTYADARRVRVVHRDTDEPWETLVDDETAAVIVQNPDVFGVVHDWRSLADTAHRAGALAIAMVDPVALAIVEPPGAMGFDVAVGEGQPLGNRLQYGGPTFGFFAVTEALIRRLPGRLVGMGHDAEGSRAFVLTLQAREQHIRRERATSNICSNHSLNALQATIYMALLGPDGLREVARLSAAKAHYVVDALAGLGFEPARPGPYLWETALRVPGSVAGLNRHLLDRGILGGYDMGDWCPQWRGLWQLAVTEKRTRAELDRLIEEVTAWTSR